MIILTYAVALNALRLGSRLRRLGVVRPLAGNINAHLLLRRTRAERSDADVGSPSVPLLAIKAWAHAGTALARPAPQGRLGAARSASIFLASARFASRARLAALRNLQSTPTGSESGTP
jgi:hypothetical protein